MSSAAGSASMPSAADAAISAPAGHPLLHDVGQRVVAASDSGFSSPRTQQRVVLRIYFVKNLRTNRLQMRERDGQEPWRRPPWRCPPRALCVWTRMGLECYSGEPIRL